MLPIIPSEYANWENERLESIRLFRGDVVWLETIGMFSRALKKGYSVDVNNVLLWDKNYRANMINKHLSASYDSPFISTTLNPQMAQVFATREWTTIYELQIPRNRVILESENMGKCNESWEILVIWKIEPDWIKRVKKNNGDIESELHDLTMDIIHIFPHIPTNRVVRDNKNWRDIR